MLLPRGENGLVIPGILRGLKSQDLEAEPGSAKLIELRLWRALQILQDPNSIQVVLILPHFTSLTVPCAFRNWGPGKIFQQKDKTAHPIARPACK